MTYMPNVPGVAFGGTVAIVSHHASPEPDRRTTFEVDEFEALGIGNLWRPVWDAWTIGGSGQAIMAADLQATRLRLEYAGP